MRRIRYARSELITKVNMTPLIDVALVLVIILLVTAPLMSVADLPVDLPQARTREAEDERNVSITLGSDGRLAIDEQVVAPEQVGAMLATRLAEPGNQDVLVVVRADSGAPYARVRYLLDQARDAGAKRLAIEGQDMEWQEVCCAIGHNDQPLAVTDQVGKGLQQPLSQWQCQRCKSPATSADPVQRPDLPA